MKVLVAVSGGVDSVVLLHMLVHGEVAPVTQSTTPGDLALYSEQVNAKTPNKAKKPITKADYVVVHVDHGLRPDSWHDALFVEELATKYGLEFTTTKLKLKGSSEEEARNARWEFMRKAQQKHTAGLIVTAHHQDDVLETMIINFLRGSGRLGMTSLQETEFIKRPLLIFSKKEIYNYALENELEWVEDETNKSDTYLRNRIRKNILPKLSQTNREKLLDLYRNLTVTNSLLNSAIDEFMPSISTLTKGQCRVDRSSFNCLDYPLQMELAANMIYKLTSTPPRDSLEVERLALGLKTAQPHTEIELRKELTIKINVDKAIIKPRA